MEWKAVIHEFEIPKVREFAPLNILIGREVHKGGFSAPTDMRLDITRIELKIPRRVRSVVIQINDNEPVATFGNCTYGIGDGIDVMYEGLQRIEVKIWTPKTRTIINGTILGTLVPLTQPATT